MWATRSNAGVTSLQAVPWPVRTATYMLRPAQILALFFISPCMVIWSVPSLRLSIDQHLVPMSVPVTTTGLPMLITRGSGLHILMNDGGRPMASQTREGPW